MSDNVNDPATLKDEISKEFEEIKSKYYPGSNKVRTSQQEDRGRSPNEEVEWDTHPQMHYVHDKAVEFFSIAALATALNRRPVTIRMWENKGYLPKASFRTKGMEKGSRRLYTRSQIEGLVAIAREEGLLDPSPRRAIEKTKFPERAKRLFAALGKGTVG